MTLRDAMNCAYSNKTNGFSANIQCNEQLLFTVNYRKNATVRFGMLDELLHEQMPELIVNQCASEFCIRGSHTDAIEFVPSLVASCYHARNEQLCSCYTRAAYILISGMPSRQAVLVAKANWIHRTLHFVNYELRRGQLSPHAFLIFVSELRVDALEHHIAIADMLFSTSNMCLRLCAALAMLYVSIAKAQTVCGSRYDSVHAVLSRLVRQLPEQFKYITFPTNLTIALSTQIAGIVQQCVRQRPSSALLMDHLCDVHANSSQSVTKHLKALHSCLKQSKDILAVQTRSSTNGVMKVASTFSKSVHVWSDHFNTDLYCKIFKYAELDELMQMAMAGKYTIEVLVINCLRSARKITKANFEALETWDKRLKLIVSLPSMIESLGKMYKHRVRVLCAATVHCGFFQTADVIIASGIRRESKCIDRLEFTQSVGISRHLAFFANKNRPCPKRVQLSIDNFVRRAVQLCVMKKTQAQKDFGVHLCNSFCDRTMVTTATQRSFVRAFMCGIIKMKPQLPIEMADLILSFVPTVEMGPWHYFF